MLKQLTYSLMAAAALSLGFTSCSSDDPEPIPGADGNVTFTVNLPASMATRAYADGFSATQLDCYVYTGKKLVAKQTTSFQNSLQTKVTFNLANGRDYALVFFAHSPNSAGLYTYDTDNATITVNYDAPNNASNNEDRDAFYQVATTGTVTGPITQDVHLYRPFAQINFGDPMAAATDPTDGSTADATSGAFIGNLKTGMTITTQMPNVLQVLDATTLDKKASSANGADVSGSATVSFAMATPPTGETFPVAGYDYLSMDYILVPADRDLIDLTFNVTGDNGVSNSIAMTNIPVQRNYRTNIYGNLLTSQTDWNVIIEPDFEGEYLNDDPTPYILANNNMSADQIAKVKDALKNGGNFSIPAGVTFDLAQIANTRGQVQIGDDATDVCNIHVDGTLKNSGQQMYAYDGTVNINMGTSGKIEIDTPTDKAIYGWANLNINGGSIEFTGTYDTSTVPYDFMIDARDGSLTIKNTVINCGGMGAIYTGNSKGVPVDLDGVTIISAAKTSPVTLTNSTGTIQNCTINTTGTGMGNVWLEGASNITFKNSTIRGGYAQQTGYQSPCEAVTVSGTSVATFLSGKYYIADDYTGSKSAVYLNHQASAGAQIILQGGIFQNKATQGILSGSSLTSQAIAPAAGYKWQAVAGQTDMFQVVPE